MYGLVYVAMIKMIVVMYVVHIVQIIKNLSRRRFGRAAVFSFDALFIIVCASVTVIFIFIFLFRFYFVVGGVAMMPQKSPFFAAGHRWM